MKKFKAVWRERIVDQEGDTLGHEMKSQIIEAENEDKACDIWDAENEHNEYQNGLDSCEEVVEHPLFSMKIKIDMPDGFTYGVPVERIARHRAERYADKEYGGDIGQSLREDTLPLFDAHKDEIVDWAINNLNWSDVSQYAVVLDKKLQKVDMEGAWVNGEHTLIDGQTVGKE